MTAAPHQTSVTFSRPFWLEGVEGTYPPGTYAIQQSQENVLGLSFIGYRQTKTTIELPPRGRVQLAAEVVEVDPADLEAALVRDVEAVNGKL